MKSSILRSKAKAGNIYKAPGSRKRMRYVKIVSVRAIRGEGNRQPYAIAREVNSSGELLKGRDANGLPRSMEFSISLTFSEVDDKGRILMDLPHSYERVS